MLKKILFIILLSISLISCRGSNLFGNRGVVTYEISFNTDKTYIINEMTFVLGLYQFMIEVIDPSKDYYVLQTYWRVREGQIASGVDTVTVLLRDRVLLHIIPRGRTSFYYRNYQVLNTVLQFECQMQTSRGNWVKVEPPAEYVNEYQSMIKEFKLRMLRYGTFSN